MTIEFAIVHLQKAYDLLNVGGDLVMAEKVKQIIIELEKRYIKSYFYFCKMCCNHWETDSKAMFCPRCYTDDFIEENIK